MDQGYKGSGGGGGRGGLACFGTCVLAWPGAGGGYAVHPSNVVYGAEV